MKSLLFFTALIILGSALAVELEGHRHKHKKSGAGGSGGGAPGGSGAGGSGAGSAPDGSGAGGSELGSLESGGSMAAGQNSTNKFAILVSAVNEGDTAGGICLVYKGLQQWGWPKDHIRVISSKHFISGPDEDENAKRARYRAYWNREEHCAGVQNDLAEMMIPDVTTQELSALITGEGGKMWDSPEKKLKLNPGNTDDILVFLDAHGAWEGDTYGLKMQKYDFTSKDTLTPLKSRRRWRNLAFFINAPFSGGLIDDLQEMGEEAVKTYENAGMSLFTSTDSAHISQGARFWGGLVDAFSKPDLDDSLSTKDFITKNLQSEMRENILGKNWRGLFSAVTKDEVTLKEFIETMNKAVMNMKTDAAKEEMAAGKALVAAVQKLIDLPTGDVQKEKQLKASASQGQVHVDQARGIADLFDRSGYANIAEDYIATGLIKTHPWAAPAPKGYGPNFFAWPIEKKVSYIYSRSRKADGTLGSLLSPQLPGIKELLAFNPPPGWHPPPSPKVDPLVSSADVETKASPEDAAASAASAASAAAGSGAPAGGSGAPAGASGGGGQTGGAPGGGGQAHRHLRRGNGHRSTNNDELSYEPGQPSTKYD